MEKMEPIQTDLVVGLTYKWSPNVGEALCPNSGTCLDCPSCQPFIADRTNAHICTCKATRTGPYCDGSHLKLNEDKTKDE